MRLRFLAAIALLVAAPAAVRADSITQVIPFSFELVVSTTQLGTVVSGSETVALAFEPFDPQLGALESWVLYTTNQSANAITFQGSASGASGFFFLGANGTGSATLRAGSVSHAPEEPVFGLVCTGSGSCTGSVQFDPTLLSPLTLGLQAGPFPGEAAIDLELTYDIGGAATSAAVDATWLYSGDAVLVYTYGVPEPGTAVLLAGGLGVIGARSRRARAA